MRQWSCILVDLDGTITDSAPGIVATLSYTLQQLGKPVPAPADLVEFVGPPIMDGFRDIVGLTQEEAERALVIYRERYASHGAFDSSLYPGIVEALDAVVAAGVPMAIATSKPERQAKRILDHFGLTDRFVLIGGASDDETRSEKADVIAYDLELLAGLGVDLSAVVMVGDRRHDVHGAAAHGIPTIVVRWGYGSDEEVAGSIGVAAEPSDLVSALTDAEAAA